MNILLVFVITLAFMMFLIMKYNVTCGIALFASAILAGLLSGMPIPTMLGELTGGFGSTMAGIGLVILFGGCFGAVLEKSGAMEEMAKGLIRKFGKKNDLLALNIAGYLISIPIFFGAGYITLSPLANALNKITKKRLGSYCCATYVGLIVTHCLVMPTPGPVAVAAGVGADMGWFMLYSLIVSLPASILGGVVWSSFLDKRMSDEERAAYKTAAEAIISDEELIAPDPTKPSTGLAIGLLMIPVGMLLLGSIMTSVVLTAESAAFPFFKFIGDAQVALFFAMLVSAWVLRKSLKENLGDKSIMSFLDSAADTYGSILLLLGAAGSFAAVIKAAGIGDLLISIFNTWNMPIVIMAFLVAAIFRMGVGSAAAAMTTSVAIVWPSAAALGYSPVVVGLAVCAGALFPLIPNDSSFWLPVKYNGITTGEVWKNIVVGNSIAGATALCICLLLNTLVGILPGL